MKFSDMLNKFDFNLAKYVYHEIDSTSEAHARLSQSHKGFIRQLLRAAVLSLVARQEIIELDEADKEFIVDHSLQGLSDPLFISVREIMPCGSSSSYVYCEDPVILINMVSCGIANLLGSEVSSYKPKGIPMALRGSGKIANDPAAWGSL